MCKTCGWGRWLGSQQLTLSTHLSSVMAEGNHSDWHLKHLFKNLDGIWGISVKLWNIRHNFFLRSSSDWDYYGTGDRLLIQNGAVDNLISIPLTQAEADMTSDW